MPPVVEADRPRIRGYLSDFDDDDTREDSNVLEQAPLLDKDEDLADYEHGGSEDQATAESPYWLFPSLLPSYTEKIEVNSPPSIVERVLSSFTMYQELKEATLD